MPFVPRVAIAAFRRRVHGGAFVAAVLQATLATAVAAAAAQIAVRSFGGYVAPHPAWLGLLLPVLLFGWWRAARRRLPDAVAAAHLDRRLGLQGLLLAADEGLPLEPAWQARLDRQLARLPLVLPAVRWRRLLPVPGLATLLATVITLLPPPPQSSAEPQLATAQAELERLAEVARDLFARGHVPDEVAQEIEHKLEELQQQLAAGAAPEWRDLDQLGQRLEREQLLQAAARTLGEPAAGATAGESEGRSEPAASAEMVAAAARALAEVGGLDALPEAMQGLLRGARRPDGTFDASALPEDMAALQSLAEALAGLLGPLALDAVRGLGAEQLDALRRLAEGMEGPGAAGRGDGAGRGEGASGQTGGEGSAGGEGRGGGAGGVGRGPGDAALSMTERAAGDAGTTMALPPGQALPSEWVPVGETRREPEVHPTIATAPGAAAASGTGGAAWQLQLAPRHRAVVQRFFDPDRATAPTKERR